MLEALVLVLRPVTLAYTLFGIVVGLVIGAIPGLTATMAVALLLPLTFRMDGVSSLIMLSAIYASATYGGSYSAILFNTPGTPSSAATCLDGYEMTKKGQAGKAFTVSTISSVFGGLIGAFALLLIAPPLSRIALKFGPLEYFMIAIFGLSIIGGLASNNIIKGLLAGVLGLLLSIVGLDPMAAYPRLTFGSLYLESGIALVPALIGMFSVSQAMILAESATIIGSESVNREETIRPKLELPNKSELKIMARILPMCSIIGTFIGILPGAGGDIATWVGYNEARRASKHPEKFGTGIIDGLAASESANNAVCASAMIPLLTLGIPGSNVTAVMLGALLIHGIIPGRDLFTIQATSTYAIIIGIILANLLFGVIGLIISPHVVKLSKVPYQILTSIIVLFAIVGSYAINNSYMDVIVMTFFGLVGYLLRRYDFPVAATILGLILGPMAENGLRQAMIISNGNLLGLFIKSPISIMVFIATVFSIIWTVKTLKKGRSAFEDL